MDMSRRLALSLAGAIVAALMVAMTGVASAQDLGCKGDVVLDPGHGARTRVPSTTLTASRRRPRTWRWPST